jgi:branched-chain amino acid transport system substrate-binding protein
MPQRHPVRRRRADYITMLNARDGGINGVKILFEECETGYATDRGVECYERLKGKGPTGAAYFSPLSTGITFALTEKAPGDKIPLLTMGYGRAESRDGSVFQWNFPLLGTYWSAADIIIQHIAKKEGGFDKLKGKKIVLVYHDSPYGKEPIALLEQRAKMHGFEFTPMPVTHPGVEQKATWLQIRQNRPDYVLLWGWGVMNSTSIKEAAAVGFPRDKMYGVWWSGAEPDVRPAEGGAKGYIAAMLQHGAGQFGVHADLKKYVIDQGKSLAKPMKFGAVLYNRGLINSMLGTEAIPHRHGQVRQQADDRRAGALGLRASRPVGRPHQSSSGFEGMLGPIKVSCADHEGTRLSRVHQWDGKQWKVISDWYTGDDDPHRRWSRTPPPSTRRKRRSPARDCSKES